MTASSMTVFSENLRPRMHGTSKSTEKMTLCVTRPYVLLFGGVSRDEDVLLHLPSCDTYLGTVTCDAPPKVGYIDELHLFTPVSKIIPSSSIC